jgi:hypothetical protein
MLTDPLPEPDNLSLPSRVPLNLIGRISQFGSPEAQLLNNFSLRRNLRAFSTSFGQVTQSLRILHGSSPERSSRYASPLTDPRLETRAFILSTSLFQAGSADEICLIERRRSANPEAS